MINTNRNRPPQAGAWRLISTLAFLIAGLNTAGLAGDTVTVDLPALNLEGLSQPATIYPADMPGLVVKLDSGETRFLPVTADTFLWRDKTDSMAQGFFVSLYPHPNSSHRPLWKVDVSGLPAEAIVQEAAFRFATAPLTAGTVVKLHRVLEDWEETATWNKPAWDGMRAGKDYEAEPFVRVSVENAVPIGKVDKSVVYEVDGFEPLVEQWRKGHNFGFAGFLESKTVRQMFIIAREDRKGVPRGATNYRVGGASGGTARLKFDPAVVRRLVLAADDVQAATLRLPAAREMGGRALTNVTLQLCRLLDATGTKYEPLASVAVGSKPATNFVEFAGLGTTVRNWAAGTWENHGLLLRLEGTTNAAAVVTLSRINPNNKMFTVTVRRHPKTAVFPETGRPRPGVWTTVKDGHLWYGDQRLRLWATVGYGNADRIKKMGFNCRRVEFPYSRDMYDEESAKRGEFRKRTSGEPPNVKEREYAETIKEGLFIQFIGTCPSPNNEIPIKALAADDSFVADGADWAEWKAAVVTNGFAGYLWSYIDERLGRAREKHLQNILQYVNPLTGKAYGQEEAIAIYELHNENGFIRWVIEGRFQNQPEYFKKKLQSRWNDWLRQKYRDDAALAKAWGTAEPLGSVALAPLQSQINAFPKERGDDFMRFLLETVDTYYRGLVKFCRAQAPAGVGINVAPLSLDTQYRPSVPWLFSKTGAEVNTFGMYFWNMEPQADGPPSFYVMDNHTVAGMPTLIYETNIARPDRYRAEYPFRVAALAAWQDWDAICFHYWGGLTGDATDEDYLAQALPHIANPHFWTGVHHADDPVMNASFATAGRLFLGGYLAPATNPTITTIGAEGIFSYALVNGIPQPDTFTKGARIKFAPNQPGVATPPVELQRVQEAVASGDQILWDWPNGRLLVDTPNAKVYAGRTCKGFAFKDGITISDFNVPFVNFALVSLDGQPLTSCRQALLTAVFDAQNTDFAMNWSARGGPLQIGAGIVNRGRAPVIVDPVSFTLRFPTSVQAKVETVDFALRTTETKDVNAPAIAIGPGEAYVRRLTIAQRGAAAPPLMLTAADTVPPKAEKTLAAGEVDLSAYRGLWHPLTLVTWDDGYTKTHKLIRDSNWVFASITPEDTSGNPDKSIKVTDCKAVLNSLADIELTWKNGQPQRAQVVFKQSPPFAEVLVEFQKKLGVPVETKTGMQFEETKARWATGKLKVLLTEAQGIMQLLVVPTL